MSISNLVRIGTALVSALALNVTPNVSAAQERPLIGIEKNVVTESPRIDITKYGKSGFSFNFGKYLIRSSFGDDGIHYTAGLPDGSGPGGFIRYEDIQSIPRSYKNYLRDKPWWDTTAIKFSQVATPEEIKHRSLFEKTIDELSSKPSQPTEKDILFLTAAEILRKYSIAFDMASTAEQYREIGIDYAKKGDHNLAQTYQTYYEEVMNNTNATLPFFAIGKVSEALVQNAAKKRILELEHEQGNASPKQDSTLKEKIPLGEISTSIALGHGTLVFNHQGGSVSYRLINESGDIRESGVFARFDTPHNMRQVHIQNYLNNAEWNQNIERERELVSARAISSAGHAPNRRTNEFIDDLLKNLRIGLSGGQENEKIIFGSTLSSTATVYDAINKVFNVQLQGHFRTDITEHPEAGFVITPVGRYQATDGTIYSLGVSSYFLKKWGFDRGSLDFSQLGVVAEVDNVNRTMRANFGFPLSKPQIASRREISSTTTTSSQELDTVVRETTTTTRIIADKIHQPVPFLMLEYGEWLKAWREGEMGIKAGGIFEYIGGAGNVDSKLYLGPAALFRFENWDVTLRAGINLKDAKDITVYVGAEYVPFRTADDARVPSLKDPVKIREFIPIVEHTRERKTVEQIVKDTEKVNATLSANKTGCSVPCSVEYTLDVQKGSGKYKATLTLGEFIREVEINSVVKEVVTYQSAGARTAKADITDKIFGTKTSVSADNVVVTSASNNAPKITSSPPTIGTRDTLYTYNLQATDQDNDALTYSLLSAPTGANINSTSGAINFTPSTKGTYSFSAKASDGKDSDTQSWNVTVPNSTPSITSTPPSTGTVGTAYSYDANANDPDNDPVTFTLVTAPSGASVNASTGVVSFTPASAGTFSFTLQAKDNENSTVNQSWTVTVSGGGGGI